MPCIALTAVAQPAGAQAPAGPFNPGPAAMLPVTPGQRFDVNVTFVNRSSVEVRDVRIALESAELGVDS